VKSHASNVEKFVGEVSANLELLQGLPRQIAELGIGVGLQKEAVERLIATVVTIQETIKSLPVAQLAESTHSLAKALERGAKLQGETERVLKGIDVQVADMRVMTEETRRLLGSLNDMIHPLVAESQRGDGDGNSEAENGIAEISTNHNPKLTQTAPQLDSPRGPVESQDLPPESE
jgi:hypothetical protein